MAQPGATQESVFIFRRLGEAFPFASPEYAAFPGNAYWLGTIVALVLVGLGLAARTLLTSREGGVSVFKWFLAGTQAALFVIPAVCVGVARQVDGELLWWVLSASTLICGCLLTALLYIKDAHTIGLWAILLAPLRMCVYVALLACFLLPAIQTWEETEKRSRVLIVIDVSPSITGISDELSRIPGVKPKTRLAKVLDFLTDSEVNFIARLTEKNPVFVYRFGTRLDEAGDELGQGSANWTREEWEAWTSYDFKPYAIKGISEPGQAELKKMPAWKAGEAGNADWATQFAKGAETEVIPPTLSEEDKAILASNRGKLEKRVDVARSLVLGTNVPDSLLTAVNRESSNMVQGIVVFSDGRSNLGSDSAMADLRDRATKEKIPIFTVAVGEKRENIEIVITDLASPDSTQPDEPQKILVEVDGKGLQNQTVTVFLDLYLPGQDPKVVKEPTHRMTKEITFAPGDPPHALAEFTLDSDELAKDPSGKELVEASKKIGRNFQLKTGAFQLQAKVARDKREIFADEFHVSPVRTMQVVDKPVRVLMVASGPNREYQTLRTLLVREMGEKRAELCIYLQTEGGITGEIVQDVPPERLLTKFPDRLDTTKKVVADTPEGKLAKYYNLDEYDLIIALDFDWNERDKAGQYRIPDQAIKNVETWVNNLGGGFLIVAAPLHTFQLARTEEDGRLKPLLNVLPVVPADSVLKERGVPRTPRRLKLNPSTEAELLKLEDDGRQDKPTAGWEKFFIGSDKPGEELNLKRGIFSYYPVKAVKPGATVLAEFVDVGDQNTAKMQPWFVISQSGSGRAGWLGSGETYRLRAADANYFDRFWLKLTRYLSAKREAKAARGRLLLNKEFTAGGPIRMQARILQPSGEAYPENAAINPKFKVTQYNANGDQLKILGPYELKARKGGDKFEGYYTGQVTADAKQFPHGDFRYKATVEVPDSPGDTLDAEFIVRKSDPELDETRPDFAALERMAGTVEEIRGKLNDGAKLQKLMGANSDASKARLTMKLGETDKLTIIPDCMDKKFNKQRNLGGIDDLWDDEYEPNGKLHDIAHEQLIPSAGIGIIANLSRVGTLVSLPFFLTMTLLIVFGQWSGLFAQLLRLGSLMSGLLAATAFLAYGVLGFVFDEVSQQNMAGKIVELSLASIIFLPLLLSVVGLFVFWSSDLFRAQAARMGALFIGLQGAFLVYCSYSFPVAIALLVVVTFLCIEWLSRKLLRLA